MRNKKQYVKHINDTFLNGRLRSECEDWVENGEWKGYLVSCFYDISEKQFSSRDAVADARLIAAARDLLEFAQEVSRNSSVDPKLKNMAIAVIAKATVNEKQQ